MKTCITRWQRQRISLERDRRLAQATCFVWMTKGWRRGSWHKFENSKTSLDGMKNWQNNSRSAESRYTRQKHLYRENRGMQNIRGWIRACETTTMARGEIGHIKKLRDTKVLICKHAENRNNRGPHLAITKKKLVGFSSGRLVVNRQSHGPVTYLTVSI